MPGKRKLIYFLIVVVVTLLILNVVFSYIHIKIPNNNPTAVNKIIIEEKFRKVLSDYGIESEWITKGKIQKNKSDSLSSSNIIRIPKDMPIAQILKDISIEFANQPVLVSSSEEKINGITNLIIESGNYIKLIADFKYDKNLNRKFYTIAFLLNKVEELNEIDLTNILKIPINFGVVLPLQLSSITQAEIILNTKKEYFISLDDNSDNSDFELDNGLKVDELKNHTRKIVSSFNSPKIFFIDNNESGLNESVKKYIEEEIKDRGRKLVGLNEFIYIKGENTEDLKSFFRFHINNLKYDQSKIFRIDIEDWITLQDELNNILKKGNKIMRPSQLL